MWKASEAANPVFQWIFALNSVNNKFFHVSIVNKILWQIFPYVKQRSKSNSGFAIQLFLIAASQKLSFDAKNCCSYHVDKLNRVHYYLFSLPIEKMWNFKMFFKNINAGLWNVQTYTEKLQFMKTLSTLLQGRMIILSLRNSIFSYEDHLRASDDRFADSQCKNWDNDFNW